MTVDDPDVYGAEGLTMSRLGIALVTLTVLATASLTWLLYSSFSRQELQMKAYCADVKTGEALERVRRLALDQGFSIVARRAQYGLPASLSVSATGGMLPAASFCTVDHDGQRVIRISYNPWYH